jgi:hypothetical protein
MIIQFLADMDIKCPVCPVSGFQNFSNKSLAFGGATLLRQRSFIIQAITRSARFGFSQDKANKPRAVFDECV